MKDGNARRLPNTWKTGFVWSHRIFACHVFWTRFGMLSLDGVLGGGQEQPDLCLMVAVWQEPLEVSGGGIRARRLRREAEGQGSSDGR